MSTRQITLVSHGGDRAQTGYGPTQHAVLDLTRIVTISTDGDPARYVEGRDTVYAVEADGQLYVGGPIDQHLADVEIDGDTVRFDGRLPFDDGGCQPSSMFFDGDGMVFRRDFSGEIPVLTLKTRTVPGLVRDTHISRVRVTRVAPSNPKSMLHTMGHFPAPASYFVRDEQDWSLPGSRIAWTLAEWPLVPTEWRGDLTVTVHDPDLLARHLDPLTALRARMDGWNKDARVYVSQAQAQLAELLAIAEGAHDMDTYRSTSTGQLNIDGSRCGGTATSPVDTLVLARYAEKLLTQDIDW